MKRWALLAAPLLIALMPRAASAHAGDPPLPGEIWTTWNWDPLILSGLAISSWLYARGVRSLWRGSRRGAGVAVWRAGAFAAGQLMLFIALISPLDPLGQALFVAHMAQHLLLMVGAAPLLVLGRPGVAFVWALPPDWRRWTSRRWKRAPRLRGGWRLLNLPVVALCLHTVTVWAWHVPALYEAALRSQVQLVHAVQHLTFIGTALLFWWVVVHAGQRALEGYGYSLSLIFLSALQGGVFSALMIFSSEPWYTAHAETAAAWGLTAIEDQQLAGFVMWVPAGAVYMLAGVLLAAAWLRSVERRVQLRERGAR